MFLIQLLNIAGLGPIFGALSGEIWGPVMKTVMRIFFVVLLVMVVVVFMVGPAGLLALLTPEVLSVKFWTIVVLIYYFLATLLPIDKLIGKLYPVFGVCLIIMAIGIGAATVLNSGFHATQSPMMARCLTSEREGRKVFYGAMVAEGVIALIWASAGIAFYEGTAGLAVMNSRKFHNSI